MSLRQRLGRIEKQLVAVGITDLAIGSRAEYKRILDPSSDDLMRAMDSTAATMPKEYVELLEADMQRFHDLGLPANEWDPRDHYFQNRVNHTGKPRPQPLTQRFFEWSRFASSNVRVRSICRELFAAS